MVLGLRSEAARTGGGQQVNAGHQLDHEPLSDGRRIGRLKQCRVRYPEQGCPCTHYCQVDVENCCLPIRVAEPIEGWDSLVERMVGA